MTFDDDDSKRRRNLVSFSMIVCVSAFLDIDLLQLVELAKLKTSASPTKLFSLALAVLFYLTWRYLVRKRDDPHSVDDYGLARFTFLNRLHYLAHSWLVKQMQGKDWKCDIADPDYQRLFVNGPFRDVHHALLSTSAEPPISVHIESANVDGFHLVFNILAARSNGSYRHEMISASIAFAHPMTHLLHLRAFIYTFFRSPAAVDAFFPYILAILAFLALVSKYLKAMAA